MKQRKIQPVADNLEKKETYAKNMARYKIAVSQGFYFEAIVIDYAMIEDRLRSMLYHMALLEDRSKVELWEKNRCYLEKMAEFNGEKDHSFSVDTLAGKISVVNEAVQWSSQVTDGYKGDRYLSTLKSQFESMDIDALKETLKAIKKWKEYRNEIMHALLSKNIYDVDEKIADVAISGMELARALDAQERILKKGHLIRRSCGLKTE